MTFALSGFCNCEETKNTRINDIERQGDIFLVKIPSDSKNKKPRSYVIGKDFCPYVQKYLDLRPPHIEIDRLFLKYRNGKCTRQVKKKKNFMFRLITNY